MFIGSCVGGGNRSLCRLVHLEVWTRAGNYLPLPGMMCISLEAESYSLVVTLTITCTLDCQLLEQQGSIFICWNLTIGTEVFRSVPFGRLDHHAGDH